MSQETEIKRNKLREDAINALQWQKLYDWTHDQAHGAILGRSCTNTNDPLGAYLGAVTHTEHYHWSIGPSIKNGYGDRIEKPAWVKRLIDVTDQATNNQSGSITREMYLDILTKVKEGGTVQ